MAAPVAFVGAPVAFVAAPVAGVAAPVAFVAATCDALVMPDPRRCRRRSASSTLKCKHDVDLKYELAWFNTWVS